MFFLSTTTYLHIWKYFFAVNWIVYYKSGFEKFLSPGRLNIWDWQPINFWFILFFTARPYFWLLTSFRKYPNPVISYLLNNCKKMNTCSLFLFFPRILIAEVSGDLSSYYKNNTMPLADLHFNTKLTEINNQTTTEDLQKSVNLLAELPENAWPTFLVNTWIFYICMLFWNL